MRSLVLEDTRRLAWHDASDPKRRHEREAIVRPIAVATCDLDQPMIFGQTPFAMPIHLGHDNITDGWRAVAPALAERPAADVLVVGGGRSIPLYAIDAALALGAASVTYVDTDAARLAVAAELGARVVEGKPDRSLGAFR